jgi:cytosolic iron-sulfur protein assembly protein CIAO1
MSISTSTTSLLSCQTTLSPPLSSIGSEEIRIEFSTGSPCWNVAFSADGKLLAACFGAPNSCVRIWELQTLTLIATLEGLHPRTIRYCSFAPVAKNYTLATASFDGTVGIWERDVNLQLNQNNMEEWECIAQLEGHESECKCVEWNNSATLLATCGRDKTVWLWDCSLDGNIGGSRGTSGDFECLSVLNGHDGDVKSVLFAPSRGIFGDGDEICISGSYDNTIRIWAEDAGDWYCALFLHESHTIWSLALAPGSIRLISGSADGSCGIYKLYTAQEIKTKPGNLTLQRYVVPVKS